MSFDEQPHDEEAEKSVLGAMLLSEGAIAAVSEILAADHYYRPAHQVLHETIMSMRRRREPVDAITVKAQLERDGTLSKVGGAPYLHTLISAVPTVANAAHYSSRLRELAERRAWFETSIRLNRKARDLSVPITAIREIAQHAAAEATGETAERPFREYDLGALLRDGVPPPDLLCGELLYAGGLHSIAGPPDCGKTTIALWWALQLVRDGQHVMFLDEEGGAELTAEKLIGLGAAELDAPLLHYLPFPARSWTAGDVTMLRAHLDAIKPSLVLWDSAAAFLSRAGLDENAAADVTRFWSQVLTPLAREHHAAVLVIDHDTKDGMPSRFARGSGAKLAACDVAFKVTVVQPFDRMTSGVLRVHVSKDRRGWLHRWWKVLVRTGDGITLRFAETTKDAAEAEGDSPASQQLPPATQKILSVLDTTPATQREVTARVVAKHGHGLQRETVSRALNELLRKGLADRLDQGNGKAALWTVSSGLGCDQDGLFGEVA